MKSIKTKFTLTEIIFHYQNLCTCIRNIAGSLKIESFFNLSSDKEQTVSRKFLKSELITFRLQKMINHSSLLSLKSLRICFYKKKENLERAANWIINSTYLSSKQVLQKNAQKISRTKFILVASAECVLPQVNPLINAEYVSHCGQSWNLKIMGSLSEILFKWMFLYSLQIKIRQHFLNGSFSVLLDSETIITKIRDLGP